MKASIFVLLLVCALCATGIRRPHRLSHPPRERLSRIEDESLHHIKERARFDKDRHERQHILADSEFDLNSFAPMEEEEEEHQNKERTDVDRQVVHYEKFLENKREFEQQIEHEPDMEDAEYVEHYFVDEDDASKSFY